MTAVLRSVEIRWLGCIVKVVPLVAATSLTLYSPVPGQGRIDRGFADQEPGFSPSSSAELSACRRVTKVISSFLSESVRG